MTLIEKLTEDFKKAVIPWWQEVYCRLSKDERLLSTNFLLAGVLQELHKLRNSLNFGSNYFNITPYTLGPTSTKILERENSGRVRKVTVWVDAASGGPTPTLRIGTSDTGSGGGGFRVNAGAMNEIGEVPPHVELWAASSTAINVYVIERA